MPAAEPAPAPASLDDIPAIMTRFGPDGRFIHAVRELRHMSLEELATETRISQRYLHAIESNDFGSLPAGTFVRGYVKEVARALGIPELGLVEGYMGLFSHHRG
jgi:transcriptional regulator with XRE-family HTH domain